MEIRTATEADVDGLVASQTGLFAVDAAAHEPTRNVNWPRDHGAEATKVNLANPDRLVLVAEADDAIVGHLLGGYYPADDMWIASRAVLISLHMQAGRRGGGAGSQLVDRFKEWARERGAVQLLVTAYAANEGAIRFYQRHGFAPQAITFESAV